MGRAQRVQAFSPQAKTLAQGEFTLPEHLKSKRGSHGACPVGIGMTDPFAIEQFSKLFIPMVWTVK